MFYKVSCSKCELAPFAILKSSQRLPITRLTMLMFGPLSFQKNPRLNLKLYRRGSDHNLVGSELDLVGGELDLVGGKLDQVQSKWGRTRWGRNDFGNFFLTDANVLARLMEDRKCMFATNTFRR